MIVENITHGTTRSYNAKGCRCDACKKANSDYLKRAPINRHGTTNSYNKGCRCEACRKAVVNYRANAMIYEHGKKWSYDKGCRCESCKAAKTAFWRKHHPDTDHWATNEKDSTRRCSDCEEIKSLEEFGKNSRESFGRSYYCRVCLSRRRRENKNKPHQRFKVYQSGAKVRNIPFNLSYDQFMIFWCKPCHYCGKEINGIGLDRKDSKGDYSLDNVVPCCSQCNMSKTDQTTEEFISMCKRVAEKFNNRIVDPNTGTTQ